MLYHAQRIRYTGDVFLTSLTVKWRAQSSRVQSSTPPKRVWARNKAEWRFPPLYTFTKLRFLNRPPLLAFSGCRPALTCRQSKEFPHNYLTARVGRVKVGSTVAGSRWVRLHSAGMPAAITRNDAKIRHWYRNYDICTNELGHSWISDTEEHASA